VSETHVTDTEFTESLIDDVTESDGWYEIKHDGGWVIACQKVDGLPAPQVGETLRLYGRGIGYTVRGITVGGRTYRYLTEDEDRDRREQQQRAEEAERERKLAETSEETDRRVAALPKVFRRRIARFRRDGGHKFRRDFESYELFCCEQAVAIARALKTSAAIKKWRALPFEAQREQVTALDDGHSGNTFGTACLLASYYIHQPELVVAAHGALVPLVGCDDYGCAHPFVEPT